MNEDTKNLLKECCAGTKMAVSSIEEVESVSEDVEFLKMLLRNKEQHEHLGERANKKLKEAGFQDKDPNPMAKAMSWMKINSGIMMKPTTNEVAALMTDGCNMGVKSLHKYMNQYANADEEAKEIAHQLISCEEELESKLQVYL